MAGKDTRVLTPKEQRFVDEYPVDLNATAAAKRAKYADSTAEKKAPSWVVESRDASTKPHVWDAVQAALLARSERTKIDADWVLTRLATEAGADLADLYEENGSLKSIHDWPEIWRTGLVGGIDVVHEYETVDGKKVAVGAVTKLKISDRIKRVELIGKHIGVQAFADRHEHTGKGGGPIEVVVTKALIEKEVDALFSEPADK